MGTSQRRAAVDKVDPRAQKVPKRRAIGCPLVHCLENICRVKCVNKGRQELTITLLMLSFTARAIKEELIKFPKNFGLPKDSKIKLYVSAMPGILRAGETKVFEMHADEKIKSYIGDPRVSILFSRDTMFLDGIGRRMPVAAFLERLVSNISDSELALAASPKAVK